MNEQDFAIIPRPSRVIAEEGEYVINKESLIWAPKAPDIALLLSGWLNEEMGLQTRIVTEGDEAPFRPGAIRLVQTEGGPAEGYQLEVSSDGVSVSAATKSGLFYGCQTLRQLLPSSGVRRAIPHLTIEDRPRFPWRGLHLDVGRHIFPVAFVKRYLDLMAMHKFNVFHWHLTDDQGWRIEIKQYPRLTEVGAWRDSTPIPADRSKGDGRLYGGYYSQDEIREIVAYAHERQITVVPEIEMPGHAVAALASYPHLGCRGSDYSVRNTWGIADDVFCAGNEETFTFLGNVLREVFALFPSEIIHVGGDECPKVRWKACPKCQARIREHGLSGEEELQSYFIRRIEAFLNENGRRLLGWDEILEGGLAPNAMVMSWRGTEGGIEAASQGHDVVMTPTDFCYLDYYQSKDTAAEPPGIGGYLPLEKVYAFNPLDGVPEDKAHHILGGQGNVWTEYIQTPSQVEYMTYPRASALAEAVWSADRDRDYEEFLGRLEKHLQRLDRHGVNYRSLDDYP